VSLTEEILKSKATNHKNVLSLRLRTRTVALCFNFINSKMGIFLDSLGAVLTSWASRFDAFGKFFSNSFRASACGSAALDLMQAC
jgi:hypothetical protein